jgi:hypothetical protein
MARTAQVLFEGIRTGGEFWGGTQADFLLVPDTGAYREVSVVLSDAAAAALAEKTSSDNNDEFRAEAARSNGIAYIEKALADGRHVPSSIVLTVDMLAGLAGLAV